MLDVRSFDVGRVEELHELRQATYRLEPLEVPVPTRQTTIATLCERPVQVG
jgi:hypothetical protein